MVVNECCFPKKKVREVVFFFPSLNKYLNASLYVPSTVLGGENTIMNKTGMSVLMDCAV